MQKNEMPLKKRIVQSVAFWGFAALIFGAAAGSLFDSRGSAMASTNSYDHLRIFAEVLTLIQDHYVEEKTPKELSVGAIKGLLRTLDPHSSYMDADTYKSRKEETEGKFGGLGIEITTRDFYITIVTPIEGTPAEEAGLQAGDKIIKIDDVSTKDMDLMDGVKMMRGEIGTDVTLTIFREETSATFDVVITRALINIKSVRYAMIDDEVGYLRIQSFTQQTSDEAGKALADMKNKNMKSLVLDLRNNPGGLLDQSVKVADLFLPRGEVVVSTRGRTDDQNTKFRSRTDGDVDYPIVVLVNSGSASASEIVAGALKDLNRALIIGTRSFGKGSVQTIRPLSDGSGLTLTTARYFTPAGTMIHGIGIEPDITVKYKKPSDKKEEPEEEAFREKDLIKQFKNEGSTHGKKKKEGKKKDDNAGDEAEKSDKKDEKAERKEFDLEKDNQLQRAVELLKSWDIFRHIELKKAG